VLDLSAVLDMLSGVAGREAAGEEYMLQIAKRLLRRVRTCVMERPEVLTMLDVVFISCCGARVSGTCRMTRRQSNLWVAGKQRAAAHERAARRVIWSAQKCGV